MLSEEAMQLLIDACVDAVNDNDSKVSAWEVVFVDSVMKQWEAKHWLSEKQVSILERIKRK